MDLQISLSLVSFLWGMYSEVELLDQVVVLFSILRNHCAVFHSRCTIIYSLQPSKPWVLTSHSKSSPSPLGAKLLVFLASPTYTEFQFWGNRAALGKVTGIYSFY